MCFLRLGRIKQNAFFSILILLFIALMQGEILAECQGGIDGNGVTKTERRAVTDFSRIHITGAFDVEINSGNQYSLSITADENILPIIKSVVTGQTLDIRSTDSYCTQNVLYLEIGTENLRGLHLSGATDINVAGVDSDVFDIRLEVAGDLRIEGTAGKVNAELKGGSDLDAIELKAQEVSVTITGAGDAGVHASDMLEAEITGMGDIVYYGRPKIIRKNITGLGDIEEGY